MAWAIAFGFAGCASAQQGSWLSAELGATRDDQPRRALDVRAEYGGYVKPALTLAAIVSADRVTGDGVSTGTAAPGAGMTLSVPAARFGVGVAAQALLGAPNAEATALWDARASVSLGGGASLRGRLDRQRYTLTVASLDTLVLVRTKELALDRAGAPGWAFELVARREDYGDANPVRTAYGWLLAPLSSSARHRVRAGYALAAQDAPKSNWVPDRPRGGGPPASGAVEGRFVPYYTPHDVVAHSVLGEVVIGFGERWLIVDGAYGVHATETAAALAHDGTPGAPTTLRFFERSFRPVRFDARWVTPLGPAASLTLEAGLDHTAEYRVGQLGISIVRQLGGASRQ
jgi:hypothetical protein